MLENEEERQKNPNERNDGVGGQPQPKPAEANLKSLLISLAGTKIWSTRLLHMNNQKACHEPNMQIINALEESLL